MLKPHERKAIRSAAKVFLQQYGYPVDEGELRYMANRVVGLVQNRAARAYGSRKVKEALTYAQDLLS